MKIADRANVKNNIKAPNLRINRIGILITRRASIKIAHPMSNVKILLSIFNLDYKNESFQDHFGFRHNKIILN